MTIPERERLLRDAARRYLAGEISYEELTAIRRRVDEARIAVEEAGSAVVRPADVAIGRVHYLTEDPTDR